MAGPTPWMEPSSSRASEPMMRAASIFSRHSGRKVVPRQQLGIGLADAADAEREDEAVEGGLRRASMPRTRLRADERAPALQRGDPRLMRRQAEDVGGAGEQPGLVQLHDALLAQALDVHGVAARRNGAAAPPSAPGRSAHRCSAAPPRRAGARHGCRRRGKFGEGEGLASAGRLSSTTETICGMTSPARCSTTVSPGAHPCGRSRPHCAASRVAP